MKKVLGVLIALGGIALGAYVGFWLLFIGGIVQIVDGVKASPVSGVDIGVGLLRFLSAGLGGWIAVIFIAGGIALATTGKWRMPRRSRKRASSVPQPPAGWAPPRSPSNPYDTTYPPAGWAPPSNHPNGPYSS